MTEITRPIQSVAKVTKAVSPKNSTTDTYHDKVVGDHFKASVLCRGHLRGSEVCRLQRLVLVPLSLPILQLPRKSVPLIIEWVYFFCFLRFDLILLYVHILHYTAPHKAYRRVR